MAQNKDEASLLREALPQYLILAKDAIDRDLGYPAAALLFVVIDTLDAFKGNSKQNFAILKTDYFGLADLTQEQLDNLYELGRCPLVHTAMLGKVPWLRGEEHATPFEFPADGTIQVWLRPLLKNCATAVERFLSEDPKVILESTVVTNLRNKAEAYSRRIPKIVIDPTGFGKSAHASGVNFDE